MSDEEPIELISNVISNDFSEEEEDKMILLLKKRFPNIVRAMFYSGDNLTPEQILETAKRIDTPILL